MIHRPAYAGGGTDWASGRIAASKTHAALIVAGATCSGKSALALAIARAIGGTVINADSMQVYRELRILTARPTPDDEAAAPHRLYGIRPAGEPGSVAWWRESALCAMHAAWEADSPPILCGGTGLYLAALIDGLSPMPDAGEPARHEARRLLRELGPAALHRLLSKTDPETAAGLHPSDGQRIARAWEVRAGTGRGLAAWHEVRLAPAPFRFTAIALDPPRPALRAAIAARFTTMLAAGALDEVRRLLALGLDPALPVMRAHGVPELREHLQGTLSLDAARQRVEHATGQYTKRQATWLRHHALAAPPFMHTIHARFEGVAQFSQTDWADLLRFVRRAVDVKEQGGLPSLPS